MKLSVTMMQSNLISRRHVGHPKIVDSLQFVFDERDWIRVPFHKRSFTVQLSLDDPTVILLDLLFVRRPSSLSFLSRESLFLSIWSAGGESV